MNGISFFMFSINKMGDGDDAVKALGCCLASALLMSLAFHWRNLNSCMATMIAAEKIFPDSP